MAAKSYAEFKARYLGRSVNVKNDQVFLKELGYWVKSRCLIETKNGK